MISMFHPLSEKNKFGYYTVGSYCTYSKYDAQKISSSTGQTVHWNFNDTDFSLHNWTIEPTVSLDELYRQRAQQIREKYDYIVLWYSGGSDSHNIAEVFRKNNIHLDEIAIYVNSEGKAGFDVSSTNTNAEPVRVGVPYTTYYKQQSPGTNIRMFDMFPLIVEKLQDPNFLETARYAINNIGGPHHLVKPFIREHPDYQKIINSGKSVCFIWGCDKPRVSCVDKKWFLEFTDLVDGSVRAQTQMLNNSTDHDEFFYWSPDLVPLIIKQAHIVKNYFSSAEGSKALYSDKKLDDFFKNNKPSVKLGSGIDFFRCRINGVMPLADRIRNLIYPDWSTDTFSIGKSSTGELYGARDLWLYESNVENIKNNYFSIVNTVAQELHDNAGLLTTNVSGLLQGAGIQTDEGLKLPTILKSYFSKKYFLN